MARQRALALGTVGEHWLATLDEAVVELEREWSLRVGSARTGGNASYVVDVVCDDGTPAVLKLVMPNDADGNGLFDRELRVLLAGHGSGYVTVFRHDDEHRAILLERLGPSLLVLGLPMKTQIEHICATLVASWQPVSAPEGLLTTNEKGAILAASIEETWADHRASCTRAVIDHALQLIDARVAAHDPTADVLVHGDAHEDNVLQTLADPSCYKLIDPDGMVGDRAYDLAIPMRGFNDAFKDTPQLARGVLTRRCERLASLTGVDARSIWDWGFVERVSTGLFVLKLGDGPWSREFLDTAEYLIDR